MLQYWTAASQLTRSTGLSGPRNFAGLRPIIAWNDAWVTSQASM